jgi:hypothetical protein
MRAVVFWPVPAANGVVLRDVLAGGGVFVDAGLGASGAAARMSAEDEVARLGFKRGDICVVTADEAVAGTILLRLSRLQIPWFKDAEGLFQVPVVLVPPGVKLEAADETRMNAAGWFRR